MGPLSPRGSPPRPGLLAAGLIALLCLVSLLATAPRSAPYSPTARRVAALLSSARAHAHAHHGDDSGSSLAYRAHLERVTANTTGADLGFDHIYVLSLPSRQDRRKDMSAVAHALGVEIEFVDAANKDEPFIRWIAERVVESRQARRGVMARARGVNERRLGGMGIASDWLVPFPGNVSSAAAGDVRPFPPYPRSTFPGETRPQTWVAHLEALHSAGGRHTSLRPRDAALNVTRALWDPRERLAVRQVHEGVISTYWGQTRAIKRVLENGDRRALILEDDVDVEWDLERLWASVARRLPRDAQGTDAWDVAFLGHCWGGELQQPMYLHPLLHRSTAPMCLHGYAVSAAGARRLVSALLDPWSAYSTAVDAVIPALLHLQRLVPARTVEEGTIPALQLSSFSIVPPLVVQRKDGPSDLQGGTGSPWRGVLRDSTVERVRRDEGVWTDAWDDKYVEGRADPATVLRCGQG